MSNIFVFFPYDAYFIIAMSQRFVEIGDFNWTSHILAFFLINLSYWINAVQFGSFFRNCAFYLSTAPIGIFCHKLCIFYKHRTFLAVFIRNCNFYFDCLKLFFFVKYAFSLRVQDFWIIFLYDKFLIALRFNKAVLLWEIAHFLWTLFISEIFVIKSVF